MTKKLNSYMAYLFHSHEWSKWEEVEQGDLVLASKFRLDAPPIKYGNYLVQTRSCSGCGTKQLRTERTS